MKVRVKTAFKDKNTNELYKAGDELEMTVRRVNEVLKVGNFIEIVEQDTEQHEKMEETPKQEADDADVGQHCADQEDAPKQNKTRKRTSK